MMQDQTFSERAAVFKALGHPARLRMVEALSRGELCVCELTGLVGADVSTVSKHLSVLREAGIVAARREGTSMHYRLVLSCVPHFLDCVDAHLRRAVLERASRLDLKEAS